MGRSDGYRRYVKECLDMANAVQDPKARASLLKWRRYGCAWHSSTTPSKSPMGEGLL